MRELHPVVRNRPLLVVGAGVGLGLGMALGALVPWSRIEDELLGDEVEKLNDGALEMASNGYEKAKSVVQGGYKSGPEIVRGSESITDSGESGLTHRSGRGERSATDPYSH